MAQSSIQTLPAKSSMAQLIPVMFCFFVMGFVDLVGAGSNYVQQDLNLTDSQANLFPSLVFFWFLIFSVPTGLLMNKIGRKKTVMLSMIVTLGSLLIPIFGNSYEVMLVAFSLLGIGNALMQTSLNPLVSNLINPSKLASTLTFGQFVKAIASFLAPLIMGWAATAAIPAFGLDWRAIFPIYAVICVFAIAILGGTPIPEDTPDKASSFTSCIKLLGVPFVFLCFLGIMCHVGIDVGTNTTAPKIIMERMGLPLEDAVIATSVYFVFRTLGCLLGSWILTKVQTKKFFAISVAFMAAAMICLFMELPLMGIYVAIGLIGFGNSNIFSMVFAQALNHVPNEKNEVSGLMIMGLFGGTLFPLLMGFCSDTVQGQWGAVAVMSVGVLYLAFYTFKMKRA